MKKLMFTAALALVAFSCATPLKQAAASIDYDQYVNQYVGTGYHGHTFLGASVPFGAIQVGPQNIVKGWDWCSGYHYSDSVLVGFTHTHMNGTGISDGGDLLIMPYTGVKKSFWGTQENPETGYASMYSHDREVARLGYYSLILDTYDIKAELTATERSAMHRYTYPATADTARLILDLKFGSGWDIPTWTYFELRGDDMIVGHRFSDGWGRGQKFFFAVKFEKPLGDVEILESRAVGSAGEAGNMLKHAKALVTYKENPGEVKLKLGVSPVSVENAILNLETEIPGWDFEQVVAEAKTKWSRELDKIAVEDKDSVAKVVFYTALYHTMISPNLYNDVNGDYRGSGPEPRRVYMNAPFQNYTMLSLWDTYRAANPLYLLTQPERMDDMINTYLNIYKQQGKLPIWHLRGDETNTMSGYSAVPIVVDAYMKGYSGFDHELAYEAVKASAMLDRQHGIEWIKKLGWAPYDKVGESVAYALEYCIGDWAVSQMAAKMGKTEDAEYFAKRAQYYKNYYDETVGYFRGRDEHGNWNPVFDANKANGPWIKDYTEGNAAQYLWLVPHDVEGLIELVGGEDIFNKRLDKFFVEQIEANQVSDITGLIGLYAHGNEPGHQTIYLYAYSGQQWKTAQKARYIMDEMYSDRPDGIIGNEDCGQMSAWYIFTAMGFYPVNTPSNAYVFGSPRFDKVTVNLAGGKQFVVEAVDNDKQNIYIQKVELNGKPYSQSFITYKDIAGGGTLTFHMGPEPNRQFGAKPEDRPQSKVY